MDYGSRFNSDMPSTNATGIVDEHKIIIGNITVEAIHLPGHSIDSMGYYVESHNLLVAGSTIPSTKNVSRWDLPTGCLPDLADSIELLIDLDLEILISGFGEQISDKKNIKSILENQRDFFDKCIELETKEKYEDWQKPAQTVTYLTPKNWD